MRIAYVFSDTLPDVIVRREASFEIRIPIGDDGPDACNDLELAIREAAQICGLTPIQFVYAVSSSLQRKLDMLADVCEEIGSGY
jgi:hypothetical protein